MISFILYMYVYTYIVTYISEILFDQVSFRYPSRPEEQVLKVYIRVSRIVVVKLLWYSGTVAFLCGVLDSNFKINIVARILTNNLHTFSSTRVYRLV